MTWSAGALRDCTVYPRWLGLNGPAGLWHIHPWALPAGWGPPTCHAVLCGAAHACRVSPRMHLTLGASRARIAPPRAPAGLKNIHSSIGFWLTVVTGELSIQVRGNGAVGQRACTKAGAQLTLLTTPSQLPHVFDSDRQALPTQNTLYGRRKGRCPSSSGQTLTQELGAVGAVPCGVGVRVGAPPARTLPAHHSSQP